MTKEEDFKLLKIQTCSLRVNIDCEGCNQKVKKLLQKMEGVYQVKIEAEHQKVTVSGCVDSATLINKLFKAGKHAELWSPNQQQPQNPNKINDVNKNACEKGQKQGSAKTSVEAIKPKNTEEEEEEEVQLLKPANQQQAVVNSNALKKGNQKQSQNSQARAGVRRRNAGKMSDSVESNEIAALMDLAGFNPTNGLVGGNGILQVQAPQPNNITNHNVNGAGLNGYNNHHPMNMQTRQMLHQPHQQIMYQRSAFIPASTNGYYYNNPYTYYPYPTSTTPELHQSFHSSATHIATDEDASCNIM